MLNELWQYSSVSLHHNSLDQYFTDWRVTDNINDTNENDGNDKDNDDDDDDNWLGIWITRSGI